MKTGKNKLVDLEVFIDQKLGKKGSKKRDAFEEGYETFKMGVMLQEIRHNNNLTQEQLAE